MNYAWPKPHGANDVAWNGRGFLVDGRAEPILSFGVTDSGWTDELTTLHEGSAGADHPIDLASRSRALREVLAHVPAKDGVVLEVGCSSGYMLGELSRALPKDTLLIGSDYVAGPLRALADRTPTQPLLRFDLTACPLPSNSVDVVVALNVLEHIENDTKAAREIARILRPGGAAVIELPAAPGLYDVYDKALMHFRRYTLASACSLFEDAGLRVVDRSHVGVFVFPAFAAVKLRNQRYLNKTDEEQKRIVSSSLASTRSSKLMKLAMKLEERWSNRVSYPFGIRCVLTAIKR
jgi:SAM-dependent methyltransferase